MQLRASWERLTLYLLEDQEEQPVAVVLPREAAEQPLPPLHEARFVAP